MGDEWIAAGKKTLLDRAGERVRDVLEKHKPNIPDDLQNKIREYLVNALEREGVRGDEAKKIMDKTYWHR